MKRIALILAKLFAVCAALGLCVVLYLFSVGYFDPQPAIGYLHSPKALPYVDLDALAAQPVAPPDTVLKKYSWDKTAAFWLEQIRKYAEE